MAEGYIEIPMTELAGSESAEGEEESVQKEKGPADLIDRVQKEKGPSDLIDHILEQIWLHPGITMSDGCTGFPRDLDKTPEFYVSGLLNIQRNSKKNVTEFKNGSIVEITCPLIIPNIEIEFECPLIFCSIPICERACLTFETTTAEVEMSVFNGNVALDFVRIISMEKIKAHHTGSLNLCCKIILRRKLLNLKRQYEEKIKETVAHFISKMMSKILRTYLMDEKIRFRSLETDEDVYEYEHRC